MKISSKAKIVISFIFIFFSQVNAYSSEFISDKRNPKPLLRRTERAHYSNIETAVAESAEIRYDYKTAFEKLKSYIEGDSSLLLKKDYKMGTLLHIAAFYNSLEAAKYILSKAPELINNKNDATKYDAKTPLHLAIVANGMGNKKKLIKFLIDNGANIKATDIYGRQPIHYGCSYLDLIMNAGADDINVQDDAGNTPLHLATKDWANKGISVRCIKEILKKDVDTNIKNADGYTALDLLKKQKQKGYLKDETLEKKKDEVRKLLTKRKWKDLFKKWF